MRILHLEHDKYPADSLRLLRSHGELSVLNAGSQQDLLHYLERNSFDAIFTRLGLMMDERALQYQENLRYIVTPTTGINHIDISTAEKKGIKVISLKGESEFLAGIKSTAEHTWLLLLALIRNLLPASQSVVKDGRWERVPFMAEELDGKTIGIIGFGRLGKIVSRYGSAFGMKVLVHDHDSSTYSAPGEHTPCDLETLLSLSDYVVLLISYSPENTGFMNAERFALMKDGAYFVNSSRGELVNEEALLTALEAGTLKGAALDVLNGDSGWDGDLPQPNPLLQYARSHSNLLLTPHMGGYGRTSIEKTRDFIVRKFLNHLTHETDNNC